MARILTHSFLFFHGKEKIKFLPLSRTINDSLSGYYSTLKQSEQVQSNGEKWMDITPFIDYMLETIESCIVTTIHENKELSTNQKMLLAKMKKRGSGAEISIVAAARILKVSEQTAGRALNTLSRIGYLKK